MKEYIFLDQDLEKLKRDISGNKRHFFNRLDDVCKGYESVIHSKEHPPCSTTYMGMAIANLSLAYILTEQKHYLEEARRWMNAVVSYQHWGNAHLVDVDLSASWLLFGLSIGYDWLKDVLPEEEAIAIKDKLILQGERMYDFKIDTEGSGWSTNYWQNHNWINLTGLASAGYALRKDYGYANDWIGCAKANFDYVYSVMAKDGSDYEGVVYWRYGAMWLFVYGHLLNEREGINYFESCDFLKNTFYYRLYQAAPNLEEQINFGDCHDRRSGHSTAIYYKTASAYNNGHAQKLGNMVSKDFLYREAMESGVKPGILPEIFFELLFYNDDVDETEFSTLPRTRYFEDLGLLVFRDSWALDSLHFSFKCGAPGGKLQWEKLWELKETKNYNCFGLSHHHPDNNSFILHANGKFMAIDDGYNRTVKASDHNVILVDGKGFEDENQNNVYKNYSKDMVGVIEKAEINDDYIHIVGESSKTYQKDLKMTRVAREVLYTRKGHIILIDDLDSEEAHNYSYAMHGDVFPTKSDNRYRYENGLSMMDLYSVTDVATEDDMYINTVRAVMTTQEPDKFRETKMKTLHITNTDKVKKQTFITVLKPFALAEGNDMTVEKLTFKDGYGVIIKEGQWQEVLLIGHKGSVLYEGETIHYNKVLIQYDEDGKKAVVKL